MAKHPVHASDAPVLVWYEGTDREIRGRVLCDLGGVAKVGVGILELPPGCNTRPAHWHSREEEHLYVLSGRGVLHLGADTFTLEPGSYVCFPAGQPDAHFLESVGTEALTYLMIGERIRGDEVTYPEGDPDQPP